MGWERSHIVKYFQIVKYVCWKLCILKDFSYVWNFWKEKFIRMVDIIIICFAYMEATVVGGSVAEGINQRWYSSLTEDYIYN